MKIILEKLSSDLLPDEEIIVINGNSNDGTAAYLEHLYQHKKIQHYSSAPDKNQAHGWNKGFMLANGKIIKKLMDDDVFSLSAIRICKNWMLDNPLIDICISNTLQTNLLTPDHIVKDSRLKAYLDWNAKRTTCFSFCDVYMLIKKSALSFTGLYDTQVRMIDWEFSLRCSFLGAKIAYYSGYNSLTVYTPGNISSLSTTKVLKKEARIAKVKYGYPGDRTAISAWSEVKIFAGNIRDRLIQGTVFTTQKLDQQLPADFELETIYNKLYKVLENENQSDSFNFLY